MKLILILFLCISQCFAIEVTPIKKDTKAPADGFFIEPPAMKEIRTINEEKKILRRENVKLIDLAVINEDRILTYKELSQESEKALRKEKVKSNLKGIGGFIIGVLATSLAAYAAIRSTK
jgi:hypothetical protein